MFLKCFYPEEWQESTYTIDFQKLYDEGYRGLLFDIDNTLVPHNAPADQRAVNLITELKKMGFKCCLVSNNNQKRVAALNEKMGIDYVWKANKPLKSGYLRALKQIHVPLEKAVYIGDQIFTDVWGAKRLGMRNILVKPMNPKEEIQIVIKRRLEWIVLYFYQKEKNRSNKVKK